MGTIAKLEPAGKARTADTAAAPAGGGPATVLPFPGLAAKRIAAAWDYWKRTGRTYRGAEPRPRRTAPPRDVD